MSVYWLDEIALVGLVSVYWLGEIASVICSFSLSVAACADLSLRYTSVLLGHRLRNQQINTSHFPANEIILEKQPVIALMQTWLPCFDFVLLQNKLKSDNGSYGCVFISEVLNETKTVVKEYRGKIHTGWFAVV